MRVLELEGGAEIGFDEHWMNANEADVLFQSLTEQVAWEAKTIRIAGRNILQPRLSAWYGDDDAVYTYSGLCNVPLPWIASLLQLKARVEGELQLPFKGALLNYYRNGDDSMGFHADNERELGPDPVVISVSLGASRRFVLRHVNNAAERIDIDLTHGSLLAMTGTTQRYFRHAVPKQPGKGPRINITFRRVFGAKALPGETPWRHGPRSP
jgi:alkylated DNA repair dioxygenase AlkB